MTSYKNFIKPESCIGIIGGGQLGKMLSVSAKTLGYKTIIVDPNSNACASGLCDTFINTNYDDKETLKFLAENTDVITYEFENIPYEAIKYVEGCGGYIPQGYNGLYISQDRLVEKEHLEKAGFKVAPYKKIDNEEDLKKAALEFGYPCILKTRSGGYDGKGQHVIKDTQDIEFAKKLLDVPCILEKKVNFEKELSAVAVKSINGELKIFPIGENIHKNGILHTTNTNINLDNELLLKIEQATKQFFDLYNVVGILTIELFLVDGEIFANEIAPRPHNSGHWTLDGANVSQFEQHIRAICGLPLITPQILEQTIMLNLLGQHYENLINNIDFIGSCSKIHLYGKESTQQNRKIGHINIVAEDCFEKLERIEKLIEG